MDSGFEALLTPWLADWMPGDGSRDLRRTIEAEVAGIDVRTAVSTEAVHDRISTADILITNELTPELLAAAEELKWIQTVGVGVDKYPLDRLAERDVVLTNAAGVSAEPIAEQVVGYLLLFERQIHRGIRQQSESRWERYCGGELAGETVGILGVGSIGTRVAEIASELGMNVLGMKRNPEYGADAVDEIFGPDGLHELLPRCEYLVVSCPLNDATRGMIDGDAFVSMNSSCVLVNVARGEIVDERALTRALQNGRIRGAALDVFEQEPLPPESPLWNLSNTVITPHMGGCTPMYWERLGELFVENYRRFVAEGPSALENQVGGA